MPPEVEHLTGPQRTELVLDASAVQGPQAGREVRPEEEARPRHVALRRRRMAHPRIDGIEQAQRARRRSIGGAFVAVVVPRGLVAPPHANATRSDHGEKRDLIAREHEADRWGTKARLPQAGYRLEIRSDIVRGNPGLAHQDVREGVRPQLLARRCVHGAEQVGCEVQATVGIELRVVRVDGEGRLLVLRRPRRACGILAPVGAREGAHRGPRHSQGPCREELQQGRHCLTDVVETPSVAVEARSERVVHAPAELEVQRDNDPGAGLARLHVTSSRRRETRSAQCSWCYGPRIVRAPGTAGLKAGGGGTGRGTVKTPS